MNERWKWWGGETDQKVLCTIAGVALRSVRFVNSTLQVKTNRWATEVMQCKALSWEDGQMTERVKQAVRALAQREMYVHGGVFNREGGADGWYSRFDFESAVWNPLHAEV